MQNRTTFMERINERVCAVEDILKKMEPVEDLLERLSMLENNIYTTKKVLTFSEACVYMGVSESLLYKLTAAQEVPHYKPRGKMLYFNKEELDQWLLQNNIPTIGAVTKVETEEREDKNEVKPYFGQKRYGRKKQRQRLTSRTGTTRIAYRASSASHSSRRLTPIRHRRR